MTQSERRYVFGQNHGPLYSIETGDPEPEVLPYGTTLQPQITAIARAHDTDASVPPELPSRKTPARKRKGTSSKEQRPVDTMDIDTNGASTLSLTVPEEGLISDAPSPIVEEPPAPIPVPPMILDNKPAQTEQNQKLIPTVKTSRISPHDSDSSTPSHIEIDHTTFSPDEPNALLLAGTNLARIWLVPYNISSDPSVPLEPMHMDIPIRASKFRVMACTWTYPVQTAVMALWETFDNEKGEQMSKGRLVHLVRRNDAAGFFMRTLAPSTKEILALRWNRSTQSLLCLSITERGSLIRLWTDALDTKVSGLSVPHVFAVEWIADKEFVCCGENIITIYEIKIANEHGRQIDIKATFSTPGTTWHRIAHDAISKTIAVSSDETPNMAILSTSKTNEAAPDEPPTPYGNFQHIQLPARANELTFQPVPNPDSVTDDTPPLLACATQNGEIFVYNVRNLNVDVSRLRLGMGRSADTCAWSGDGFLLAAAGGGRAAVWRAEDILAASGTDLEPPPLSLWMAEDDAGWGKSAEKNGAPLLLNGTAANGHADGGHEDNKDKVPEMNGQLVTNGVKHDSEMDIDHTDNGDNGAVKKIEQEEKPRPQKQNLIWDRDGKKLIYATGDHVRLILLTNNSGDSY